MRDINKPARIAFFDALDGQLTYGGVAVPVSDELLNETANNYVLLTNQTSTPDETKSSFSAEATMTLDIVSKSEYVTKNIVDDIADQILIILRPTSNTHTLTPPASWQFLNFRKSGDTYITTPSSTSYIIRRILTFSFRVVQN